MVKKSNTARLETTMVSPNPKDKKKGKINIEETVVMEVELAEQQTADTPVRI
jgi:hypothetical protein